MKLKYVGGSDAVELTVAGAAVVAERGKVIEVPDEVAGRPPEPRLAEAMAELQVARVGGDHQWQRDLRAEIAELDAGEGLLAQDIWQSAEPKKNAPKEDDK